METIESLNDKIDQLEKDKAKLEKQRTAMIVEENRKTFKEGLDDRNASILNILEAVGYYRKVIPLFEIDRIYDNYDRWSGYQSAVVTLRDRDGKRPIFSLDAPFNQILNWSDFIVAKITHVMMIIQTFDSMIFSPYFSRDTIELKSDGLTIDITLVNEDKIRMSAYATLVESNDEEININLDKHAVIRITPCEGEAYFTYDHNDVSYLKVVDTINEIISKFKEAKASTKINRS